MNDSVDMATRQPGDETVRSSTLRSLTFRYPNLRAVAMVWSAFFAVFAIGAVAGWVTRLEQVEVALILASFALVVAFGQQIVVLTGGIDLSVPFTITGSSIVLTSVAGSTDGPLLPILAALGFAAVVGIWNGAGVAVLNISPLIMTLATNVILLGLILAATGGTPSGVAPVALVEFMTGSIGPVKVVLLLGLFFSFLGTAVLLGTSFGRYVYAIGNSRDVAYLSGVPSRLIIASVYIVASLSYGVAGVMLSGWNQQASFQMGNPYLFPSIAAVVLGGTSILGGRGSYLGTVGGAALFAAIGTILAATTFPESFRNVVIGVVMLIAVAVIQRERLTD